MNAVGSCWRSEGENCLLICGNLQGRVEFDSLGVRFIPVLWQSRPIDRFRVLSTGGPRERSAALNLAECYVRGCDLIATYEKTGPGQLAPQIDWRASNREHQVAVQLEMVLSVRTDLLDSQPLSTITSFGLDCRLFHLTALRDGQFQELAPAAASDPVRIDPAGSSEHLFLLRDTQRQLSYAQMVHPSDFVGAEIHSRGPRPWSVDSNLFPERLEKGVIRRGRICGWFMPSENDLETAVTLARQFVNEPLPLTA